jgi:hypothetical protein
MKIKIIKIIVNKAYNHLHLALKILQEKLLKSKKENFKKKKINNKN